MLIGCKVNKRVSVSMSGVYDLAIFKGRMYFSVRHLSFLNE